MMQKEIRLTDYVKILWKRKTGIAAIVLAITLGTIIYSYTLPLQYRAEAVIIPVAQGKSDGGGIGGLISSLPLMGGAGGAAFQLTNSFLIYMNSNEFKKQVATALDLVSSFFPKEADAKAPFSEEQKLDMAAQRLGGMVTVTNDRLYREKIIISAVSADPQFAAKLARQYLVELQNYIANNALTQIKRQMVFLEKQLAKNKVEILEMGKALSRFYGKNPVSAVRANLNVPVAVYTKEGVRDFKDYKEFKAHFDMLQREEVPSSDKEIQYVSDVPHQVYLNYVTVQQSVLENSYGMLIQSYEQAKIEMAKQEPSFQVLDEPVVPLHRFSPNRKSMAKTALGFSLLLGVAWAFYMELFAPKYRLRQVAAGYEKDLAEEVA